MWIYSFQIKTQAWLDNLIAVWLHPSMKMFFYKTGFLLHTPYKSLPAPVLPSPQSLKQMYDQSCTKHIEDEGLVPFTLSICQGHCWKKKKRYWSFLTCCAPSPLTIGEVRRGISLLKIEVVSSNGGCSAIIDSTLIHKITCKEKLLKWLN